MRCSSLRTAGSAATESSLLSPGRNRQAERARGAITAHVPSASRWALNSLATSAGSVTVDRLRQRSSSRQLSGENAKLCQGAASSSPYFPAGILSRRTKHERGRDCDDATRTRSPAVSERCDERLVASGQSACGSRCQPVGGCTAYPASTHPGGRCTFTGALSCNSATSTTECRGTVPTAPFTLSYGGSNSALSHQCGAAGGFGSRRGIVGRSRSPLTAALLSPRALALWSG